MTRKKLLPLPISPVEAQDIITEAFALLPGKMASAEARVMITAICLQESNLAARRQYGDGPARGLPQFERGGGVRGVLRHPASQEPARNFCAARGVPFTEIDVWGAMEFDDVLSMGMARLLLWTDARWLPAADELIDPSAPEESASWQYYARNWRPGKPHPEKWPRNHELAVAAVRTYVDDGE